MTIIRYYSAICVLLIILCIMTLFIVKYEVQKLATRLQLIESSIQQKHEAIHMLKAELAYLSKPRSIQALVDKHLKLKLISPEQIRSLK
ncbi:MAG: cell division protein FtsL [Candidatus Lariskella arthropodorum]